MIPPLECGHRRNADALRQRLAFLLRDGNTIGGDCVIARSRDESMIGSVSAAQVIQQRRAEQRPRTLAAR
jgi:hypothetical protein